MGGLGAMLPLLLLIPFVFLLFWSSRSQQKKQQQAIAGLKKGDRVLTNGGFAGKLVELGDRFAKVELAPGVKVDVLKSSLLGKDSAETAESAEKKK
ncbi:MAG: preprotein translocase subunit YajC [Sorangiineae bacterium]|nr:preprotein translocase subunit YajC [Sorangiineae bacterium]